MNFRMWMEVKLLDPVRDSVFLFTTLVASVFSMRSQFFSCLLPFKFSIKLVQVGKANLSFSR